MKLPLHTVLSPLLKPNLSSTYTFCQHPIFAGSVFYTYFYGVIGLFVSVHHLKKHLGVMPYDVSCAVDDSIRNIMVLHDLRIISNTLGILQYTSLLIGCATVS
ncbi:unnamed protein product [Leptidea sinapis]|uniref:Uncharacterized protein n=1 Tax=Leptidea sinapis TaxID=189913 RepID=A0A5E4QS71_9NEOP|nr:unnamed protein product [Leptidea sinapis]